MQMTIQLEFLMWHFRFDEHIVFLHHFFDEPASFV